MNKTYVQKFYMFKFNLINLIILSKVGLLTLWVD
jgi:hypothetical protein